MSDDFQERLLRRGSQLFKRPDNKSGSQGSSPSLDPSIQPEHPDQPEQTTTSEPDSNSVIAPAWIGNCLRLAGEAFSPTLVLRLRNGNRIALANSYFSAARLESGDQLELDFVGHAISIRGRRLAAVFEALAAQRALELAEAPSPFEEDATTPFIETIAIVATQER